jgi:hypothetical protein
MRKSIWLVVLLVLAAVTAGLTLYSQNRGSASATVMPAGASFRILLGVTDSDTTKWDGSVKVSPGQVAAIRGWRFTSEDSTDNTSSWKASTRLAPARKGAGAMAENGVIVSVTSDDPNTRFDVKTAQGSFSFRAADIGWGDDKPFLDGRVLVDRAPTTTQLTSSTDEQDFPAIAQSKNFVYLAYTQFVHSDREMERRNTLTETPKDFNFLTRPVGGDQVFLVRYSKSNHTWGPPMNVTPPHQDVMRSTVAVDGQDRVWVVWSARQENNFDIYARVLTGTLWSQPKRLTTDPGSDLNPVAATDAGGRVWVAWQGYRNNNLEILAAVQNGDAFNAEATVSFSKASDWDPAIAAAPNGEVAVVWDTYDKGDYDVYFRNLRMEGGTVKMDAPVPVAASPNFEARATAAYDGKNRLWVAYEASDTKWGKDFGAYETTGIALYQDHTAKVKCFQGKQELKAASDLAAAIPGNNPQNRRGRRAQAQAQASDGEVLPNAKLASERTPSGTPQPPPLPKNSFPRIAADSEGAIYLAFRTPTTGFSPMGTVWGQHVAYLDGNQWKGPIAVPASDNLLDVRAAVAAIAPGDLMMVTVADHRASAQAARINLNARKGKAGKKAQKKGQAQPMTAQAVAAINTDLFADEFRFGTVASAQTTPGSAEKVSAPDPVVAPERQQVKLMRDYRVGLGSDRLQIMRGEFHRHTEISGDGGNDGPLIDAYRYMIDAASMDWGGCCDHDNGNGREYSWWIEQKLTDAYHLPGTYTPMFAYERSVVYPEGHRNVVMPKRGVRPLPRMPLTAEDFQGHAPDTQMLYRYLKEFGGIVASHTSGTNMGTDWRDNDPMVEPVVEIYQGDRQNYEMPDAPRSNNANDSIGGWRPLGFVSLALKKGYRLAFQASSDHISTHMSYCNLWVTNPTREGVMEAFHKRRVYGATDNILADVRSGSHFMGEEFTTSEPPVLTVKLWGTANFAKVRIVKDNNYVYGIEPNKKTVDFTWRDTAAAKGSTSYYYVRGEQADGELVWVSPMWITYK